MADRGDVQVQVPHADLDDVPQRILTQILLPPDAWFLRLALTLFRAHFLLFRSAQ